MESTIDGQPSGIADAAKLSAIPPPDSKIVKRQRQPRNTACQACAGLKMNCVRQAMADAKVKTIYSNQAVRSAALHLSTAASLEELELAM